MIARMSTIKAHTIQLGHFRAFGIFFFENGRGVPIGTSKMAGRKWQDHRHNGKTQTFALRKRQEVRRLLTTFLYATDNRFRSSSSSGPSAPDTNGNSRRVRSRDRKLFMFFSFCFELRTCSFHLNKVFKYPVF